ncbi:MAG: SPOR domain-containing protein [Rickettsiales bacterium]|jgi:cell division septation protein DedD|nr:SPOR domain-containing protein [Rickettsiales bacterium]
MKDRQGFFYLEVLLVIILVGCSKKQDNGSGAPSYRIVGKDGKVVYIERKRPKLNEDYIAKKKMEENSGDIYNSEKDSQKSSKYSKMLADGANVTPIKNSSAYTTKSVIDDINENNDLESFAEILKRGKNSKNITDFDYLPAYYFTDDRKDEDVLEEAAAKTKSTRKNNSGSITTGPLEASSSTSAASYGVKNLATGYSIKTSETSQSNKTTAITKKRDARKPSAETAKTKSNRLEENSKAARGLDTETNVEKIASLSEDASSKAMYYVQLGTFVDKSKASALFDKFHEVLPNLRIEEGKTNGGQTVHKVLIGGFSDKTDVDSVIGQISAMGHREIYVFKK